MEVEKAEGSLRFVVDFLVERVVSSSASASGSESWSSLALEVAESSSWEESATRRFFRWLRLRLGFGLGFSLSQGLAISFALFLWLFVGVLEVHGCKACV